jgi:hypothetical protein
MCNVILHFLTHVFVSSVSRMKEFKAPDVKQKDDKVSIDVVQKKETLVVDSSRQVGNSIATLVQGGQSDVVVTANANDIPVSRRSIMNVFAPLLY